MENTHQAQRILNSSHEDVRRYMPGVLPRLAMTYFIPIMFVLLVAIAITSRLSLFVPQAIAPVLGLVINLVILLGSWKVLDSRNKATGLFVLYTHYSRHRRDLEALLKSDDADGEAIHAATELVAASAEFFINMAQESGVKPVEKQKK